MVIELFISHSHKDSEIADKLIRLIEGCMKVKDDSIRCTSVEGYGLKTGTSPNVQLLNELKNSRVVVGIISPNSIRDAWPLSEMACAWGLDRQPICFLIGGLTHKDVEGPLSGTINTIASDRKSVVQFLGTVREALNVEPTDEPRSDKAKREFMAYIERVPASKFSEPTLLLKRKDITNDRYRLKWKQIFEDAPDRVLIWGLSLRERINANTRNLFAEIATSRKQLHFLIMDHEALRRGISLNFGPICSNEAEQVVSDVAEGERVLKEFRDRVEREAGKSLPNLELRKTNVPMSWSGVAIDHADELGRIQIEMYQYDDDSSADHLEVRPNMILNRLSPFYGEFARSIDIMWKNGQPF